MTTTPVLALPNFIQPFTIETDACEEGIGAVLMQMGRPFAYLSKKLAPQHLGLSVYEKEFMAVLLAIQKWKHYIQGSKFVIKIDQQSLKHLLHQRISTPLQQKWITKFLGLDYEIYYKRGVENKVADALSRKEIATQECWGITRVQPTWVQQIKDNYVHDPYLTEVIKNKGKDQDIHPEFEVIGDILRHKGIVVVGNSSGLRHIIFRELHASSVGGHSGIQATLTRVKKNFFSPKMTSHITQWVKECEVCAITKPHKGPYPGLLQPLPIPDQAWSHISTYLIEGLPKSHGKDVILVVVDRLTKFGHFIPLSHPFTAHTVARVFLDTIFKLHGQPLSILTDRGTVFASAFWKDLFKLLGSTLNYTSSYHPETDGQTERLNQCLESYPRALTHQNPKQTRDRTIRSLTGPNLDHRVIYRTGSGPPGCRSDRIQTVGSFDR
ncbi:unnamed protein product [Cuscuta europaea]|uniref:Integrase catalytic domain-containing protein n=1 Tax=Cuscuta europaea TaxID=41803 RepID=A0A9P0YUF1_CUSEU|nr:unnamed protein product [Cuscuta europaea]